MAEQLTIAELLTRVRAGDEAAAAEIVQRYEPQIRRIVQVRLTEKERYLADQRALGWTWAEIAAELNQTPDALRMQLTRSLGRVAKELGLETGEIT